METLITVGLPMLVFGIAAGYFMGYTSKTGEEERNAYERQHQIFIDVMKEVDKYIPEENERVAKLIAKKMADDVLKMYR